MRLLMLGLVVPWGEERSMMILFLPEYFLVVMLMGLGRLGKEGYWMDRSWSRCRLLWLIVCPLCQVWRGRTGDYCKWMMIRGWPQYLGGNQKWNRGWGSGQTGSRDGVSEQISRLWCLWEFWGIGLVRGRAWRWVGNPEGAAGLSGSGSGDWFDDSHLLLNVTKTKEMCLNGSKNNLSNPLFKPITVKGQEVEQVSSFKYLGTVLDQSFTFTDHVECIYKKAQQRLYLLCKLRNFEVSQCTLNRVYQYLIKVFLMLCHGSST